MFRYPHKKNPPKKIYKKEQPSEQSGSKLKIEYSLTEWKRFMYIEPLIKPRVWISYSKEKFLLDLSIFWQLFPNRALQMTPHQFIVNANLLEFALLAHVSKLEKTAITLKEFDEAYFAEKSQSKNLESEKTRFRGEAISEMNWEIISGRFYTYIIIDFAMNYEQRVRLVRVLNLFYKEGKDAIAQMNGSNEQAQEIHLRADLFCKFILPRLLKLSEFVDVKMLEQILLDKMTIFNVAKSPYTPRMGSSD